MTDHGSITLPDYHLHFHKYGTGDQVLLAFHGFGQTHNAFKIFDKHLGTKYTIYSFDLFFHGKSTWGNDEIVMNEVHIKTIFTKFITTYQISKFSTVGYSMGGKFALSLAKNFSPQIEHVILIAPDGLYRSIWYKIATELSIVRWLFIGIINKPGIFFAATKLIKYTRIVNKKVVQFGERQMATAELRGLVYNTWTTFRKLYYNKSEISKLMKENDLYIRVYLGKYDRIISPKRISPYFTSINNCSINILEAGHNSMIEATAKDLYQSNLTKNG